MLDSYSQAKGEVAHRSEAMVLHRVAMTLDARTGAVVPAAPATVLKPEDKAKDEELQRLKDELAKATAELERIKRRLASPKP